MRLPERLPSMQGWTWRLFVVVWLFLLISALITSAMAFVSQKPWQTETPDRGIGLILFMPSQDTPVFVQLVISEEAKRAGIAKGDVIISINGEPVGENRAARNEQLAGPEGTTVNIVTQSHNAKPVSHRLTRGLARHRQTMRSFGLSPNIIAAVDILTEYGILSILPLIAAAILLVRRARDPLAPWVSLCMIFLPLGNGPSASWLLSLGSTGFQTLTYLANDILFLLLIVTLSLFPDARFAPRVTWLVVVATIPLTIFGHISQDIVLNNSVLLAQMFAAIALVMARYRAMLPGTGRQQIRWALFGFGSSWVMFAIFIILQAVRESSESYATYLWAEVGTSLFGSLTITLLLGGMGISLMRYRLYDADAAISRSVALGALTLSLLAVFAGSEKLIELFGEEYFGESMGVLAGGIGAAVAAVLITPIHHRVTHWAERRFQSALVHLRHGLPLLVADMRENASPATLANTILARVEKGVRATHGAIVRNDGLIGARAIETGAVAAWVADWQRPSADNHALDVDRADPLFPIRVPLRADGIESDYWLILGPRPDGSFYGRDERETLQEIADPIARSLAVASERKRREGRTEHEIGRLAAIVAHHERLLNELRPPDVSVSQP